MRISSRAISDERGVFDNFGRVIAEALERGKSVITTDGAPAWRDWSSSATFTYLTGYREGDDKTRVQLLVDAIKVLVVSR